MDYEEIFGEDVDLDEVLNMIRFEDYEGASNIKDELSYNSGWYNYSILTFDYKEKRYTVQYKEHTSDNVSDMEYIYDIFVCLGTISQMDERISGEDLSRIISKYQLQMDKQLEELNKSKKLFTILSPLSKKQLKKAGDMLISVERESVDEGKPSSLNVGIIGEFLLEFSSQRIR